ncbi:MAG: cbb3-type cytochrome c oxidase subunit I, partial [Pseudomonadota bacterium]
MPTAAKLVVLGVVAVFAAMAANFGHDLAYRVHALLVLALATFLAWRVMTADQRAGRPKLAWGPDTGYDDDVIRAGVIATAFWGIVGFLVGVLIAFQLAFPALNFDLPWTSFGRMRPLHTSAVIFAFGGNALIATSFYIVQRTCGARLVSRDLAWFVFWGYQFFIVLAATGYVLGQTQSKEYAEPEWYIDIWLTIVWV